MNTVQNRLTFFKSAGILGAGLLVTKKISASTFNPLRYPYEGHFADANQPVLTVAHLTDTHAFEGAVPEQGMMRALQDINQTKYKVDFILNGGDAIMNMGTLRKAEYHNQWKAYHQALREHNQLTIRNTMGNHDLFSFHLPDKTHREAKRWAMDQYGMDQRYYAFTQQNWKFIVLDSIHGRDSLPGYYGKLDEEQLDWLKKELAQTPSTMYICISTHIPILSVCTLFDGETLNGRRWNIADNCMHADSKDLTTLFQQYPNIKVCLSGHIHLIDHVNYLGVDYYCNGAVCGSWWKGSYQQFAPAYALMRFYTDGTCKREVKYYAWQGEQVAH